MNKQDNIAAANQLSDQNTAETLSRRGFLSRGRILAASAASLAVMGAGTQVFAASHEQADETHTSAGKLSLANDRCIIQKALAMEFRTIATYELAVNSEHLDMNSLDTILALQSNHQIHAEALQTALKRLCKTAEIKTAADYAKEISLPVLNSQQAVLEMVAKLELASANTYLNSLPEIKCDKLNKVVARLAADDSMHWTLLRVSMGQTTPARAMSFGA